MSMETQIAEAERMQRWGYAAQLRAQAGMTAVAADIPRAPEPQNAAPEGGDAVMTEAPADELQEQT